MEEGGGETSTFPFEIWHYRYLEGIGENIDIEFVDTCQCGDYHMTIDRSEKDALLHTPGAGATMYEQMGMAKKADRFKGGMENLGNRPACLPASRARNLTVSSSMPSCRRLRRSSSRTWSRSW